MTSTAQFESNFANAQKSTGPRTEKGKYRTRLNAYRHGLTGQIQLLTAIAEDHWRLKRARAIETGIFALGHTDGSRDSRMPAQCFSKASCSSALAYSKGEKYDPASDFPPELLQIGSDFSITAIRRLVARNQRLTEARHSAKTQWGGPMACQAAGSGATAA